MGKKHVIISDYVCFDLETTGFGRTAEIIDIGAVKVRSGEIVDTFSELVKPSLPVCRKITDLTGITNEMVRDSRRIDAVLPDFFSFIGDDILVGHNIASFDIPMIRRQAAVVLNASFEPSYIDTVYLSKRVQGVVDNKLQTMLDHYGIENSRAHRAFEDSEATSRLFAALIADGIAPEVRQSFSYTSVEEYRQQANPQKEHIDNINFLDIVLDSVEGLRLVLTGDFAFGTRDAVKAFLTARGAKVCSSVTKKTDFLIVGSGGSQLWKYDNGGGKVASAIELTVDIISEDSLAGVLHTTEAQNV